MYVYMYIYINTCIYMCVFGLTRCLQSLFARLACLGVLATHSTHTLRDGYIVRLMVDLMV